MEGRAGEGWSAPAEVVAAGPERAPRSAGGIRRAQRASSGSASPAPPGLRAEPAGRGWGEGWPEPSKPGGGREPPADLPAAQLPSPAVDQRELERRRTWAAQGCSMSAAGRALPVFKRSRRESPAGAGSARWRGGATASAAPRRARPARGGGFLPPQCFHFFPLFLQRFFWTHSLPWPWGLQERHSFFSFSFKLFILDTCHIYRTLARLTQGILICLTQLTYG